MARHTQMHLPDDDYLLVVGQLAYMVASVEGMLLFDLPGFAPHLPIKLRPENLANGTTGQIGRALEAASGDVSDDAARAYIEAGAAALIGAAEVRNHLLHSRPATAPDGRTRLHRWSDGGTVAFWITDDWIAEQIDWVSNTSRHLNKLRPLDRHASFPRRS